MVQERGGNTLEEIGIGKDFFSRLKVTQQLRESMAKWDYISYKASAQQGEMVFKVKRPPTGWQKNFASYMLGNH
jgi:hypothetical protein